MTLLRVAACAGLLTLGLLLPAAFSNDSKPPAAKPTPPATAEPKPNLDVKVFRLKHADPAEVQSVMDSLLGPQYEMKVEAITRPHAIPINGLGFGGLGAVGGIGGFGGGVIGLGGPPPVIFWRAAVSEQPRAIVVRGSPRHLEMAAELVSIYDRPEGAPIPKLKIIRAVPLKHADASTLFQIVGELAFEGTRLSVVNDKLLLVVGPEAHLKTIAELATELDVKPEPEPEKE